MTLNPTTKALLEQTEWLRSLARSLVIDQDRADDITQETLLLALRRRDSLRHPRAWLARVARSIVVSLGRGEQRRRRREHGAAQEEALPSAASLVEQVELQRHAAAAVLGLAEPYRSAILLRFFEGLSHADLAARMGVKLETARTRLKRGLKMLRRELDAEHGCTRSWAPALLGVPDLLYRPVPVTTAPTVGGLLMMTSKTKAVAFIALILAVLIATPFLLPTDDLSTGGRQESAGTEMAAAKSEKAGRRTPERSAREVIGAESSAQKQPNLVVTGRLIDEETDAAIRGAAIFIRTLADRYATHGDAATHSLSDGSFRCAIHRPQSTTPDVLVVRAGDRAVLSRELDGRPDENGVCVVDVGELYLAPGTEVSGRVVSADGARPVANAFLYIPIAAVFYNGPEVRVANLLAGLRPIGRSGADGRFTLNEKLLPNLRPTHLLAAGAEGLGWTTLELRRQHHRLGNVELRLRPSSRLFVDVRDERGRSLQGVRIQAQPLALPLGNDAGRPRLERSAQVEGLFVQKTDAGGSARFNNLPFGTTDAKRAAGSYGLVATANGFQDYRLERINLSVGETARHSLQMQRIVPFTLTAVVRAEDGKPIAGAKVEIFDGKKTQSPTSVRTNVHGEIRLEGFATGRSRLGFKVSAPGFAMLSEQRRLTGGNNQRFEFQLARAAAIHGRVVDQDGEPVVGARASLDGGTVSKKTTADGEFRFLGIKVGDHSLTVLPPSPRAAFRGPFHGRASSRQSPLTIVLHRIAAHEFAELVVDVVDAATGRPLDPVSAQVFQVGTGRYGGNPVCQMRIGKVVAQKLHPGRWRLRVNAVEGHRCDRMFAVQPGQKRVHLRVAIGSLGSIEGRVDLSAIAAHERPTKIKLSFRCHGASWVEFDANGLPRKRRRAVKQDDYTVDLNVTNRFRLEGVEPSAPVTVEIQDDKLAGSVDVEAKPGVATEVVLRARRR